MIKVDPMPDELCNGHEGRIKWINGWSSSAEMKLQFEIELKNQGVNSQDLPKLHLLALISGKNPEDYAKNHSMMPILRVAALDGSIQPHGARNALTYSRRLGMLVQRQDARCCTQCVAEDLLSNQFSWHRRTHQLIGIDWCIVHNSPLTKILADNPFNLSPHVWVNERKISNQLPSIHDQVLNNGFVRRYEAISIALLERSSPISAVRLNHLLAAKARTLGLRTSMSGKRKLLSDLLFDMAPINWLAQHVSGFADKKPLQRLSRIDTLLSMKTAVGTGDAYAIALAVLYESAEEALSAFQSVEFGDEPPNNVKPMVRPEQFWKGDIWSVYVSSKGSIIEMAERLQMERGYLGKKLADLGFPSLHVSMREYRANLIEYLLTPFSLESLAV